MVERRARFHAENQHTHAANSSRACFDGNVLGGGGGRENAEVSSYTSKGRVPFAPPQSSRAKFKTKRRYNNKNDGTAYVDDRVPPGVELAKLFGDGWIA